MFLIDAIKHNIKRNSKPVCIFTRLYREDESGAYKKTFLFLFVLNFICGNKNIIQKKRDMYLWGRASQKNVLFSMFLTFDIG